mgnify:FL=1
MLWQVTNVRELWEWYLDGRVENGRVKVLWNYRMCRKSSVLAVGNIKGEIMYFELKENKPHGTKDDPFSIYHIKTGGRSFQIPVHWHDELEIIYVKSGFLTVSISGENYIGTPGDAL